MKALQYRYPGIKPFEKEQAGIFFGRYDETRIITRRIESEKLLTIHGKSGIGKSSLVKAGVIPLLEDKHANEGTGLQIIETQFGYYQEGMSAVPMSLVERLIFSVRNKCREEPGNMLDQLISLKPSLWLELKKLHYNHASKGFIPVFYIDQFEEVFSYPEPFVNELIVQLSELFYGVPPKELNESIERAVLIHPDFADQFRDPALRDFLFRPFEVNLIVTVRSDQMDQMDRLKKFFPDLARNTYMLNALEWEGAEEAIRKPAQKEGDFLIEPFTLEDKLVTDILSFLTQNDRNKRIEAFELQLFCQHIEQSLTERIEYRGRHIGEVMRLDLPEDLGSVIHDFYRNIIHGFDSEVQNMIRVFIEDRLILDTPGKRRRMSLDQALALECLDNRQDLLDELKKTRLISEIRTSTGAYIYELSHDALIEPICEAAKRRRQLEAESLEDSIKEENLRIAYKEAERERYFHEQERKRQEEIIRLQQERAEETDKARKLAEENLANQKKAAKRKNRYLVVIILLCILSGVMTFKSIRDAKKAEKYRAEAEALANKINIIYRQATTEKFKTYFENAMDLAARGDYMRAIDMLNIAVTVSDSESDKDQARAKMKELYEIAGTESRFRELMAKAEDLERTESTWPEAVRTYQEALLLNRERDMVQARINERRNIISQRLTEYRRFTEKALMGDERQRALDEFINPALRLCSPEEFREHYDFFMDARRKYETPPQSPRDLILQKGRMPQDKIR